MLYVVDIFRWHHFAWTLFFAKRNVRVQQAAEHTNIYADEVEPRKYIIFDKHA